MLHCDWASWALSLALATLDRNHDVLRGTLEAAYTQRRPTLVFSDAFEVAYTPHFGEIGITRCAREMQGAHSDLQTCNRTDSDRDFLQKIHC
jgi:hypothetical protein